MQVTKMSDEGEQRPAGLMYECISCGKHLTAEEIAMTPEIKCPFCGYRVLRKARPPIVKRIKAR
jgi:DNA-directed RNA polymerase subunit P